MPARIENDRLRAQHVLPEMRDLPRRGCSALGLAGSDVDDGSAEQIGARGLESVLVCARERMTTCKPAPNAESLRARHNRALHRTDIGDERAGFQMGSQGVELRKISGGWGGKKEQDRPPRGNPRSWRGTVEGAPPRRPRAPPRRPRPAPARNTPPPPPPVSPPG